MSRIQISLADGINKSKILPEHVLIMLDGDLIEYLDFCGIGFSVMMGTSLEWLCNEINGMILDRKKQLKPNAKCDESPCIYWVELPRHKNFEAENSARIKFNLCLASLVKKYSNMRIIKMKEHWVYDNPNLVINNKITVDGLACYWKSVDAAVKFNCQKHQLFLAKALLFSTADGLMTGTIGPPTKGKCRRFWTSW